MNPPPAIELSGLYKNYNGLEVLKGLNLKIKPGTFFGLLGPNGAGKSTTINIICGLANRTAGTVEVFGKDVTLDYRNVKRRIGLSQQEYNLDRFFELAKYLSYHAKLFGLESNLIEERVEKLLNQFGLWEHRNKKPHRLSGGLKRRVMLVKALIHDPDILILDEPTAGVDVELRLDLWNFLKQINQQGKTIFLTTHYLEEAQSLCDEIAIISKGLIAIHDTTQNVLTHSKGNLMNYFISEEKQNNHVF
jgi:ABC-2 type transport system ATP-binding protein